MPRLLKTGAVTALTCLALGGVSARQAQAQTQPSRPASVTPIPVQLGISALGPAPITDAPQPFICWAPGTPPSVIAASERLEHANSSIASPFRVLGQGRWTRTATNGSGLVQGLPTTIRYSIVPDGLRVPGGPGGDGPSNLRARLNQIYGSQQTWLQLFAQVGAALSAQTGLTYVYEPNDDGAPFGTESPGQIGVRGDQRIGGKRIDGDFNVLAFNFAPDFGDMVIDTADSFFEDTTNNSLGFRNTVTHEFGHGLGLAHSCPGNETKLMEPQLSLRFDGPQFDDIMGLQRFYGDRLERNSTAATATTIGPLSNGTVSRNLVSVDGTSDADFFNFTLPADRNITVTVTPAGTPFLEGPQNADGTCSAGTLFDPRTVNDLGFELLRRASPTAPYVVVRTGNSAPIGEPETVSTSAFPAGGDFQVRVFGGTVDAAQLYNIDFVVGPINTTPEPTPTPTPPPAPIRPVVDLNGANPDGTVGQNSPVANGIDYTNPNYVEGGGPQVVAPPAIVLADVSKADLPLQPGDQIVEARVQIAFFAEERLDPQGNPLPGTPRGAPDNRTNQGNAIEVLDLTQETKDILAAKDGRRGGIPSQLNVAYNNDTQTLTITGGRTDAQNFVNIQDFNRRSYEIAFQGLTYENKFFRGNTNMAQNRQPQPNPFNPAIGDRFITYVVDTDNDATNNRDDRFRSPQEGPGSNPKQSRVAVANLFFGERRSLVVTTLQDVVNPQDDQTSLREAMQFANEDGKDSAITFNIPGLNAQNPGTIRLNSALPQLFDVNIPLMNGVRPVVKTSITGPGARLINIAANGNGGIFTNIDDLTLTGFSLTGAGGTGVTAFNSNLTVDSCMIKGSGGSGIASFTNSGLANGFAVSNCAIIGNAGTGIQTTNNGQSNAVKTTAIINSTISGNRAGGMSVVSRPLNPFANPVQAVDPTNVALTTIAGNNNFGLLASSNSVVNIGNTIVNTNNGSDVNVDGAGNGGANVVGRFATQNGNNVGNGNATAQFTGAADTIGMNPLLGRIGNNGGNTDTQRLLPGSPAINTGVGTPTGNDQRGANFPRAVGQVDKGAYEVQGNNRSFTVTLTPRAPGRGTVLTANASGDNNGAPVNPIYYRYLINGVDQLGASGNGRDTFTVPDNVTNGDVITVIVAEDQASANNALAPQATDSVTVGFNNSNTAPTINSVTFAPNPPLTNDQLRATVQATDDQNDALRYNYQWTVNGTAVRNVTTPATTDTLDLSITGRGDRGDRITLVVTATETQDGGLSSAPFTVSTNVGNSAPVANNITFDAVPGQTTQVELKLRGNDPKQTDFAASDPDRIVDPNTGVAQGDVLSFSIVTGPTQGTAEIQRRNDGRFFLVYTANADATGSDTVVFKVTDNAMASSPSRDSNNATATASFGDAPPPANPNRPPVVVNTTLNAKREVPVSKGLAASDPDQEYKTLTLKRVFGPRKGTGEIRKDANGNWALFYKASGLYTGNDEVRFVAIDNKGAISNVGTITINLFNTAPTARSTSMQVAAGGSADVGIFGQDVDREELTFKSVGGPTKGTGEFRKDANGNTRFFYQNSPAATGDDEVRFVAIDSNGTPSEIATLSIKVIGFFNRAPSATNVSAATVQGQPVTVPVAGTDPDEEDVLTFKRVGGPVNGSGEIRPDGAGGFAMFYTPRADFVGTETIRYVALDQKGRPSKPATITIRVTAAPSAPSAIKSGPSPSAGGS